MISWTSSSSGIGEDSYASRFSSVKAISLYAVPFFLPGERGLAPGAHEARRRNIPSAWVVGLATHEIVVELVADADASNTICVALFNVFYVHIGDHTGKISQPRHVYLRRRENGDHTKVPKRRMTIGQKK